MRYATYSPPPPLDRFIECLWYWQGSMGGQGRHTVMASGRMGLIVNLKDDVVRWYEGQGFANTQTRRGTVLGGTQSGHTAIDSDQPELMGCQFRAGGAFPFFGPAAQEFRDAHVALEDIWGARARSLQAQLVEAPTPDAKFRVLMGALLAAMPRDLGHHPAVDLALNRFAGRPGGVRISEVAAEMDLSDKRFIALFTQEVGLTPKLYLRIARFQRLLAAVWDAPTVDWAQAAFAQGYYDQSHLIRDFRQFSGFSPGEYWRRRGPYPQHVALTD